MKKKIINERNVENDKNVKKILKKGRQRNGTEKKKKKIIEKRKKINEKGKIAKKIDIK